LIDVGTDSSDVRLYLSKDLPPDADYLTLSHCWGTLQIEKLTSTNLASMLNWIRHGKLSKTFRDAIVITRRLGHRYLWIDSWCILQDRLDDWQQEAAQMVKVYLCAFLNIAALDAPDGETGCFFSGRNPRAIYDCEVAGFENAHDTSPSTFNCAKVGYNEKFLSHSPLTKRAWVY
jgi:hypothetical protein